MSFNDKTKNNDFPEKSPENRIYDPVVLKAFMSLTDRILLFSLTQQVRYRYQYNQGEYYRYETFDQYCSHKAYSMYSHYFRQKKVIDVMFSNEEKARVRKLSRKKMDEYDRNVYALLESFNNVFSIVVAMDGDDYDVVQNMVCECLVELVNRH